MFKERALEEKMKDYASAAALFQGAYSWLVKVTDEGLDIFNNNIDKAIENLNEHYANYREKEAALRLHKEKRDE